MLLFTGPAHAQEHGAEHAPAPAGDHGAPAAHEGAAEHGGGHGAGQMDWELVGYQASNLILFLILVVWAARRPIMDALGNRANVVRRDLDDSARAKGDAQREYHEIEEKLAGLERRIEEMKADAAREAEAEAGRIRERAVADAQRIKETAERTVREEALRARNEIRREVVEQAAQLAREIIQRNVGADDQARLQDEFMGALRARNGGDA